MEKKLKKPKFQEEGAGIPNNHKNRATFSDKWPSLDPASSTHNFGTSQRDPHDIFLQQKIFSGFTSYGAKLMGKNNPPNPGPSLFEILKNEFCL